MCTKYKSKTRETGEGIGGKSMEWQVEGYIYNIQCLFIGCRCIVLALFEVYVSSFRVGRRVDYWFCSLWIRITIYACFSYPASFINIPALTAMCPSR